ncbi:MAG TPA: TetR/AcrR family transcriptional regulator [Acidimicrobiales bacterium]|nr:TetR/AcrR family transcriptional regulator [Acidimicrobiales bacterium]
MASGTAERVLDEALVAFGTRGFAATSLDDLAGEVGVTKQAILYHFDSKEQLLEAVIDRSVAELAELYEGVARGPSRGLARVEDVVRTTFAVAARRPELLGLLRQVSRLGDPHTPRLARGMHDLLERACAYLGQEMEAGRLRRHDPRLLLLTSYSAVMGVATEPEVMRAMGVEPSLRSMARARREMIVFLRAALTPVG